MKNGVKGYGRSSLALRFLLMGILLLALHGLMAACDKHQGEGDLSKTGRENKAGQEDGGQNSEAGKGSGSANQNTNQDGAPDDFKVPDIAWRLAEPDFEKKDTVVYGYSITDFGVEPGGQEDITGKVQAALLLLNREGGGTLYFPAGEYVLESTINVPKGVTICGEWKEPTEEDKTVEGTVLKIYAGRGKGSALPQFILQPNSCVRDLTIWYPEQTAEDIQEYPPTFQLFDPSVWGADYTHVKNITLVNSYIGVVQGPNGSGCPNIRNLYGTALHTGVSMDGVVDIGRCDYVRLSADYWIKSGYWQNQDEGQLERYLYENATGITLGRVDWSYFTNTTIEGYAVGLMLREGEMQEQGNFPNGQVYRHTYENCAVGILVEGVASVGEEFAEIKIADCGMGIVIAESTKAQNGCLQFYNSTIQADTYALLCQNDGDVSLLACVIEGGEISAKRGNLLLASTVTQKVSGSRVIVSEGAVPDIDKAPDMSEPVHKPGANVLYVYQGEASDQQDHAAAIQKLLDQAGDAGGGVVFLPPGEYGIGGSLTVPRGVELKGAINLGRNPIRIGTILRVRESLMNGGSKREQAETDPAAVTLQAGAGISGIVFDYPEQDFTAPIPYPYTIRGAGANVYVVNISLRGAYYGVDLMTNRCDSHYVEYLSGICMKNVLKVGGGSTSGRVFNTQINFICITAGEESKFGTWDNSPKGDTKDRDSAALKKFLQENLVVLEFGDARGELIFDNFSYNGLTGVRLAEENGKALSGWCVGQGVDYTSRAFVIEALGEIGFVNTQLVSYRESSTQVDEVTHIILDGGAEAQFVNVSCWARPDTANLHVKQGELSIWNLRITDVPDISVVIERGASAAITNASYYNNRDFTLCKAQGSIQFTGGTYNAGLRDQNQSYLKNVRNRNARWDMPSDTLFQGNTEKNGQTSADGQDSHDGNTPQGENTGILFAEGFTAYPAMAGGYRAVMETGSFDGFQTPSEHAYAGLAEEGEETYVRLYCDDLAVQTYLKSSSVRLESGADYGMELRLRIDSINSDPDYGMFLSMTGLEDGREKGNEICFRFYGDHSFAVQEKQLGIWQEAQWYRIRMDCYFSGEKNKYYTVTLFDDTGKELASSGQVKLRAELQEKECVMSGLQLAMIGSGVQGSGINDMLVDYVLIYRK